MIPKFGLSAVLIACLLSTCISVYGFSPSHRSKRSSNDAVEHWIREAMVTLTNLMKTGLPELGIAPLEPIKLENFTYEGSAGGADVKANFTDMKLFGLSTMQVTMVKVDMSKLTLELKLKFANLTITGRYNLTGKMLKIFPLYGNDNFNLWATDAIIKGESSLKTFANGSVALSNFQLDMEVDHVKSHFHKLNGGGATSGVVNRIINFFGDSIFEKAKPKLVKKIKDALESTLNRKLQSVNVFKL